jgi:hypothetical protein
MVWYLVEHREHFTFYLFVSQHSGPYYSLCFVTLQESLCFYLFIAPSLNCAANLLGAIDYALRSLKQVRFKPYYISGMINNAARLMRFLMQVSQEHVHEFCVKRLFIC